MGTISRASDCSHTVNGLLQKRADLFNEAERIRDRLAEIRNHLAAIDRTLGVLDYNGDLDAAMPRQKREVIIGKGDLWRTAHGYGADVKPRHGAGGGYHAG